jgi:cell division septation protein DedD
MKIRTFFALMLVVAAGGAAAATRPAIVVEAIQMPAWVVHTNGTRDALTLGRALDAKDRVVTGPGARALLHLADGSYVAVGENGTQALDGLASDTTKPRITAKASKAQLTAWVKEATAASATGVLRKGGKWRVYLAESDDQYDALKVYDKLRDAGYAAEIRPVARDAGTTYRVRISNFATKAEAAAIGGKLNGKMGVTEPKVSK